MRDTYKAILLMLLVPILTAVGLSEECASQVTMIVMTILTGVAVATWKYFKK